MPYDTDDGEHHVCVLMPGKMQFFATGTFNFEGSLVNVLSVSRDDPALITTSAAHGVVAGDLITFVEDADADISGAVSMVNTQLEVLTAPTTTTLTAKFVGARVDEGTVTGDDLCWHNGQLGQIRELTLPYTTTDLIRTDTNGGVKFTQDHVHLFLFNKNHETQLVREDLTAIEMVLEDGPYLELNTTVTTLGFSGTTGSVTVTASAVGGINGGDGFKSTDVGRVIRVQDPVGDWTWMRITAFTSTTVVTALIEGGDLSATTAVTTWRLGLYSDTTGWPTHGVFHESRLWLCSDAQTGRLDGSAVLPFDDTEFFSFSPTSVDGTVADDNAVAAVFNSTGRNRITWLSVDDTGLIAGSSDGTWIIQASSLDDPITPTSIQARRKSRFKASDALPAIVNRSTVFVGDLEKEVIELRRYEGGFDAKNVSRTGEHLTAAGLEEIYYANASIPILWARTSDNQLVGSSFRRDVDGEQTGWHQHNLTFDIDPDKTAAAGKLHAMTVMKQSDKDSSKIDTLWVVVERNGNFCLEYLTPFFDQSRIELEGFYVDSGKTYDISNYSSEWNRTGDNQYTFYGLHHLNGDTVDVVFRAMDLGTAVVADGKVTVDVPPEALLLDSSFLTYENSDSNIWYLTDVTYTFSSGYVSDTEETDISETSVAPPPGGGGYLLGEDGAEYYITMGWGNADDIWLVNKTTGAATLILSQAQMFDDMQVQGQDPLALMTITAGGTRNGTAFAVPGTPYFIALGQYSYTGGSPNAAILVSYYKINSAGAREHVGGFVDWRNSTSTVTHIIDVQKHAAIGFVGQARPLIDDILLAFKDNDDFPSILRLPNITSQVATFDAFDPGNSTTGWGLRQTQVTAWATHFLHANRGGTGQEDPYQHQAFFLPTRRGGNWGSYLASYVPMSTIQGELAATASPSSSYILAQAAEYPTGFMTAVHYTADVSGKGGTISSPEFFNCRWRDDTANAVIPFADTGKDKTGATGDFQDDYLCPSVFPTDPDDPLKPWMVFFPRQYYNRPDLDDSGTFMGVRIFQWSPVSGTAIEVGYKEGSLFDITVELGVSKYTNNPASINVHWDRTTDAIQLQILYFGTVPAGDRFVISDFGTLAVDVTDNSEALVQQNATTRGFDAVIGVNFRSNFQLLRPQQGSQTGPDLGKNRYLDQFATQVHRTGPYLVGTEFDTMDAILAQTATEASGRRPLFSGVHRDNVSDNTENNQFDGQLALSQDRPGPGSFLAVGVFKSTQDE
jgi:hypothetical protein